MYDISITGPNTFLTQSSGTWSPVIYFNEVTANCTFSERIGSYVRHGNLCWFNMLLRMEFRVAMPGTGEGSMQISMPFTSGESIASYANVVPYAIDFPGYAGIAAELVQNYMQIRCFTSSGSLAPPQIGWSDMTDYSELRVSGLYRTV